MSIAISEDSEIAAQMSNPGFRFVVTHFRLVIWPMLFQQSRGVMLTSRDVSHFVASIKLPIDR